MQAIINLRNNYDFVSLRLDARIRKSLSPPRPKASTPKKSELSSEASREANARRMSTADKNLNESTICLLWRVQQTGCPPPPRHASKGNLNFSRNLCVELEVFL
jgi:hypothetical protein